MGGMRIGPAELASLKLWLTRALVLLKLDVRHNVYVVESLLHDASRTRSISARQALERWGRALETPEVRGGGLKLYMHFPYCQSRCLYCKEQSELMRDASRQTRYLEDSRRELEFFAPAFEGRTFSLWGIGGGTPSLLDAEGLRRWLEPAARRFTFAADAMRNIEFNPISTDREKLEAARALGFNRVSFGVQSLDAKILRSVNRGYQDRDKVRRAIGWARDAGFEVINADLIFGLIGESVAGFLEGFQRLAEAGPTMITVSCLDLLKPYGRAIGWSAPEYERYCESLLPEVIEKLPSLAARAGFKMEEFWPHKEWYFAARGHEVRLSDDDGTTSTLGLGWHSGSHVFRSAMYVRKRTAFDPDAPMYNCASLSPREEMGRYLLYQLGHKTRVSYDAFRLRFGKDPREAFPVEFAALRAAGKIRDDEEGFDFLPTGSAERVFYICFFFLASIAKLSPPPKDVADLIGAEGRPS